MARTASRAAVAEETTKKIELNERQCDIVALMQEGLTTERIAEILGVDIKTLDTHRSNIRQTLGAKTSQQAVTFAWRLGLVPVEGDFDLLKRHKVEQKGRKDTTDMRRITPRMRELLALMLEGVSTEVIGETLGIDEKTVDNHRAALRDRMSAKNAQHAITVAVRIGVIPLDGDLATLRRLKVKQEQPHPKED